MNVLIFDTETANLEKPFCYNVGYLIANTENGEILLRREYVVEQVWHNTMLFSTAYYADKRPIYVNRMRARKILMDKWGYIMQRLYRDIVEYEIADGYAYNCKFDEKVFEFNCDWFKTINPLDSIKVHDIRGYVCEKIAKTEQYIHFCEANNLFTESGNYSTTAEAVYRFINDNPTFDEEHTALADSEIEFDILWTCVVIGAEWNTDYNAPKVMPRVQPRIFSVIDRNGERHEFAYTNKRKIPNEDGVQLWYRE